MSKARRATPRGRVGPKAGAIDFGDLGGTEPVSRAFGGDRGTPLDRYYIEGFLARHAADIRGRVLEIGEDAYTRRFGAGKVTRGDILDAPQAGNPNATIVADLATGEGVPKAAFDCIVLTQTLHMIYDVRGVLATIHRALKPGGVVLATVPGISQIDAHGLDCWFWYMTPRCAELFFAERFRPKDVVVSQHGNVLAATAFLQGIALEEVDRADLDRADPLYPVITTVRAMKGGRGGRAVVRRPERSDRTYHCERSEATQGPRASPLGCFRGSSPRTATLLAMTGQTSTGCAAWAPTPKTRL